MNLDLSNLSEQFSDLDLENIAQWPPAAKFVAGLFLAVVVSAVGYALIISEKIEQLDRVKADEITLKEQYKTKYHISANLDLFKAQMKEAESMFANQLKSLPDSHETPGLLDDITFVGTTSDLNFVKLNWQPEITREIYVELPIDIEVIGSYHDFGHFVSKIAGLPRIVTLHNFKIARDTQGQGELSLKLQAKTYRYKESETE
ncbi:type 4a pilus biogenesis protein PilO [Thalassotalea sp. PLHSN55]|uniref:type 4a pilus biogenesis protein PilO n=1 Tax=Thalassotalea sp. PLHSN55 TaxID=3435888 RepID=UPI003F86A7D1